jgi:uncharacterized protein DUF3108
MLRKLKMRPIVPALAAILLAAALASRPGAAPASKQTAVTARTAPRADVPQTLPRGLEPPAYAPGPNPFHDGEMLVYEASWLGIPAATARIELHHKGQDSSLWRAQAWVRTNRAVDVLFKMRDYMEEDLRSGSFAPVTMYVRQQENQRFTEYRVKFDHSKGLVTMVKTNRKGSETQRVLASNAWGPFSGTIMALSQPLAPGGDWEFHVFGGSSHYVFDFHIVGREKIHTAAGTFDTLRIVPTVVYVSNDKFRSLAHGTTVWVSTDARRLPVRIEAQMFIGTVRADLVEAGG